ncbi:channel-forming protein ArfA/OmpATb [Mycolicibacter minnesotensis]
MRARLIGAALVTALLGAIGYLCWDGVPSRLSGSAPVGAEHLVGPAVPVSVTRLGTELTLAGDVADPAARRALLDAVITSRDDITIVDRLGVVPGAPTPDFSTAAPVFEAAAGMDEFTVRVSDAGAVILGGIAAKPGEAAAVAAAAEDAWPRSTVIDEIVVGSHDHGEPTEND